MDSAAVHIVSYNPDLGARGACAISEVQLTTAIEDSINTPIKKSEVMCHLFAYDLLASGGVSAHHKHLLDDYCRLSFTLYLASNPNKALKVQVNPPAHIVVLDWMGQDNQYRHAVFSVSKNVFNNDLALKKEVGRLLDLNAKHRPNQAAVFANIIDVPFVQNWLKLKKD